MTDRPMTDQEVLASRDDALMMQRPNLWPHLLLPLKRPTKRKYGVECGVLYPAQDNEGKYHVKVGVTIFGPLSSDPYVETYETADAVVAAGWKVD